MKFKINKISHNRKTLYIILSIMIVSVFALTVVYASLSATLNIMGSTEISSSSWDIHLANVEVKKGSVSAESPQITGNDSLSFEANLATPGDFYEFTVDVVNDGSIDAMIDSVVKTPELTTDQAKYIKYEITYANGESINEKQTLKKETTTPIKVRIEYRKDLSASDLPSVTTELSLSLTLIYVQSDGSGTDVKDNGVELPEEYVRLNYIQSTGTQYIDTGYVNSGDYNPYKIEADFQFTDLSGGYGYVFGTTKSTGNHYPLLFGLSSETTKWTFGHYGGTGSSVKFGTADTDMHNVKYVFGEGIYFDGTLEESTVAQAQTSSNGTKNIGLFAAIKATTPTAYGKLRMYSCKFYEADDVLVRNFIPVKRIEDGKIGMYDLVEGKFYTNAGTGEFIGG